MKKNRLLIGLASMFLLGSFLLNPSNTGTKVAYADGEEERIAEPGMVAYAATYDDSYKSEPQYSTQNSTTFQYLNLGHTLEHYRGDSVKVGIIDSGINYDHEDFMASGSTKVEGDSKYYTYEGSSWVPYKASQQGYSYIDDTLGHGTNVAATVAAAINSVGGIGLAPNVELYVYKVTNSNNGYEFGAIQTALKDAKTLGLDVVNMSFQSYEHEVSYGGSTMPASTGCSTILSYYLNQAYNAGITLVAAAGNYNTAEPSYPGSNNHVINVGSLNETATDKAGFSNYGSTIDLVAPGFVHVADKGTNSSYRDNRGTSFSAPLVTAAIALYKQQKPSATPAQIEAALYASCDAIDDSGSQYSNWAGNGSLNVAKFLGVDVENGPTDIQINNPEIVNEELELELGDTLDLDWTVNGNGTFDHSVNFYTLSGEDNVVSVNSNGRITATGEGSEYVVIESNADSNVYASVYVTVTSSSSTPTITSVSLNTNSLDLDLNGTTSFQLTATVNGTNNPPQDITWLTSDESKITVTQTGLVTAVATGTAYVYAHSAYKYEISATCTVYITDSTVHVTGVSLNKNSTSIVQGQSEILTATVSPDNATNKNVTWTSSNTNVATVSDGVVTAVSTGNTTITVRTVDQSKTATCTVTVTAAPQSQTLTITMSSFTDASASYAWYNWTQSTTDSVSISGKGELYKPDATKMQFNKNRGNNVAAIYNTTAIPGSITKIEATSKQTTIRSWTAYVTSTACSSSGSTLTFGINKTTVGTVSPAVGTSTSFGTSSAGYSYFCIQENDSSASFISEFKITYTPKTVSSIAIKTAPTKTIYEAGEYFDPAGLVITANYSDSTSRDIEFNSGTESLFTFNPTTSTALTTSDTSVSITYGGKSTSQSITVSAAKTLSSISISGYTTSFVEGDTFSFGGTVTAYFSDSSTINVTESATFTGYNMTSLGNQTVTVSYMYKGTTKTQTYSVTINQGTLSSISVAGQKTVYTKNATFAFDGTCTATFANGYQKVVTPTSVSSPDMSTGGSKEVTISYTYNGITKTTSYNITVNAYRSVFEQSEDYAIYNFSTITTSSTASSISGCYVNTSTLSAATNVSTSSSVNFENGDIRLASSSKAGSMTFTFSNTINKIKVNLAGWTSTEGILTITNCSNIVPNSDSYSDFERTLSAGASTITLNSNKNNRVKIKSITFYSFGDLVDIGESEDCVGLETFINTYMHMDYVENLGYCSDSEHHYYSTAKTAFNGLNEHQRSLFTGNAAYLTEWTRLSTWASKNGDSLNESNQLASAPNQQVLKAIQTNSAELVVMIVASTITLSAVGGYFLIRRRKEQ